MEIFIEKNNRKIKKNFNGPLFKLLKELDINPGTVIVVKNDELVTEDSILVNNDKIKILSVVSGG